MKISISPINWLNLTIKLEKIDSKYYAEIIEKLRANNEDVQLSYNSNSIDEIVNYFTMNIKQIYAEHPDLSIIKDNEEMMWKILLFNPEWDDEVSKRKIIKWDTTRLFQLNSTKYWWAKNLYPIMIWNFWVPEKVKWLWEDAIQYKNSLTEAERRAYDGILSFLIFLDSIQTVNLPNINDFITAPEVNLILSIQDYQEAIHSQSYTTILETAVPAEKRDDIYYFWRDDKYLLERIDFIGWIYQDFVDNKTDKNFFRAIIWNYLLESIYFYNWFAFFDTLADLW